VTQPPSSTAGSTADIVLRAGAVHTLVPGLPAQGALAVRGDRIVDIAPSREGVDDWIGPATQVIDAPESVVLPTFDVLPEEAAKLGSIADWVADHRQRCLL